MITVAFTNGEYAKLLNLMNLGVQMGGLNVAHDAAMLLNKLSAAHKMASNRGIPNGGQLQRALNRGAPGPGAGSPAGSEPPKGDKGPPPLA